MVFRIASAARERYVSAIKGGVMIRTRIIAEAKSRRKYFCYRLSIKVPVCCFISFILTIILFQSAFSQDDREMIIMRERLLKKIEQYQKNPSIENMGAMTGLWRDKNIESEFPLTQIMHLGDVLAHFTLKTDTGELNMFGVAEKRDGVWSGWWYVGCVGCCPGMGWWAPSTFTPIPRKGALIRSYSKKVDPETCTLTDEPSTLDMNIKPVRSFSFKEILPGKLIHIVAAPTVGNQPAQYKAQVTLQWDYEGMGIATIDLAVTGQLLVKKGKVSGEYNFLTDRSGKYMFLLVAYNAEGQTLHFEIQNITIPAIPGIGR